MEIRNDRVWALYSDENQKKLLAMAYTEDQIQVESEFYSEGVWFEYDYSESRVMTNERKYDKNMKFLNNSKIRPPVVSNVADFKWVK